MTKLIAAFFLTILLASDAFATSGWDHYSVDIRGRFRIHEVRGFGSVHRIDTDGKLVEPAVCSNLELDNSVIVYGRPPDYSLTKTHLFIRYPHSGENIDVRNYFIVELDGENVIGPLTAAELEDQEFGSVAEIKWETPRTAAEKFQTISSAVLIGLVVMLVVLAVGVVKAVRWVAEESSLAKRRQTSHQA